MWPSPRNSACPQPVEVLCSQEIGRPPVCMHALGLATGKSRGLTSGLDTEAQATGANPAHSQPRPAPSREPQAASRSPPPLSGALFSLPPSHCHKTCGPALGRMPACSLQRFCAHRIWTPISAHACFRARNGEERGPNPRAWYRNTSNGRRPSTLATRPAPASVRGPWSAIASAHWPLSGGPATLTPESPHIVCSGTTPCENRGPLPLLFANPQRHGTHRRLSQGPSSHYCLEIATAPAGFMRPMAQPSVRCPPAACGCSVLVGTWTPTSVHARFRAGNGEERGRTQHTRNPTLLLFANPQPHGIHRCLSQGPMVHYSRRPLPTERGPCAPRDPRVAPYSMFQAVII